MARGIYLDNSTTTKPSEKAVGSMFQFFTDLWGVPSAPHMMGQELFPPLEESYRSIYKLLGAGENDSFVFTSSGAESVNNVFLSSYFDVTLPTGKNHYITASTDEAPALMSVGRLEQMHCVGKMVDVTKDGLITTEAVAEAVTPRTALISLSWANGLTGIVHPVAEIRKICKQRGILFHLDATHVLGKLFFELEDISPDFITFNGDNFHAPKGTGGLYIKNGVKCSPLIIGGLEQAGHRAGNVNIPACVAFGQAARETLEARDYMCTEIARLRDKLEKGILDNVPDTVAFFQNQERLPNITTIAFPRIANEAMLFALNKKQVYASIGGGSFQQIGLILIASGIPEVLAHTALSFSLSRETTEDEIDRTIAIVTECAHKLRKLSTHLNFGDIRPLT